MKEKIMLLTLDRALKSVALFKKEEMIINGYKLILTEGIKFLKTNINSLNPSGKDEIPEKRLKKERNKYTLNSKIYENIIKLESILSKSDEVKALSNEYKDLFRKYKEMIGK